MTADAEPCPCMPVQCDSGCVVRTVPDGVEIVRAGPKFAISDELLYQVITAEVCDRPRWAQWVPAPDGIIGGLLKINAVNGRVIYRMTQLCPCGHAWIGEWPD